MTSAPVISVNGFSVMYANAQFPALDSINLEVQPGEFILLAGSSGCGKSTLIRCLNGIIPHLLPGAVQGSINVYGENMGSKDPEYISKYAGSVFQNPKAQFFHTTVLDEIAFGPENKGLPRNTIIERVDEALELFGLTRLKDRNMYELSSGEQQRVAFAAIYATGPDIYFLDEPSANLDAQSIKSLKNALAVLKDKGKTIVIAEHRLYYLSELVDKVVILENGKIKKTISGLEGLTPEAFFEGLRPLDLPSFVHNCENRSKQFASERGVQIFEARGIEYRYPTKKEKTLRGVSNYFSRGEILALVGPNGSGKTTFIKLASGLLKPQNGAFYGEHGERLGTTRRRNTCSLVLQECSYQLFYPTVQEELLASLASQREHVSFQENLLKCLGLESCAQQHPQNLSAGQQQRLVFALATLKSPKILILDEPTSGLDAWGMKAIGEEVKNQAEKGSMVIVATHDVEFIYEYCDRAIVMSQGIIERNVLRKNFSQGLSDILFC
jgi:energy-coupling factor transport system ATP-binding protein